MLTAHPPCRNTAGKGTDHTFQREREPSGEMEHSCTAILRKRERIRQTESSDSSSEDESLQPTTSRKRRKLEVGNKDLTTPFDPSKEKEAEEFRFRAPNVVNSYMEKHFRRTVSKEERTAMLSVHPKPDTPAASPPKLDQFISNFAG